MSAASDSSYALATHESSPGSGGSPDADVEVGNHGQMEFMLVSLARGGNRAMLKWTTVPGETGEFAAGLGSPHGH